jgi:hypothetical protein
MSMIATISEDIPLMMADAQARGSFDNRIAKRIPARVGTQKAMGSALPVSASHMMPAKRTTKGRINPVKPPLNSSLCFVSPLMMFPPQFLCSPLLVTGNPFSFFSSFKFVFPLPPPAFLRIIFLKRQKSGERLRSPSPLFVSRFLFQNKRGA